MQDVRLGDTRLVLADILKAAGRTIVAVADDHTLFYYEGSYLTALAIRVLCPDAGHVQIALVKLSLFLF